MDKLLLNVLTCQMFICILLGMVCSHPWVNQWLLNIYWLHFLMSLPSNIFRIWVSSWWSHSSWSIRCLILITKIINFCGIALFKRKCFLLSFTVLISTILLIILSFTILLLIDIGAVRLWILIFGRFLYWRPILILSLFFLLLLLLCNLDLLLFFSLFLLLLHFLLQLHLLLHLNLLLSLLFREELVADWLCKIEFNLIVLNELSNCLSWIIYSR